MGRDHFDPEEYGMESWTPVGVPMYATTKGSGLLLQVLGFGSESGTPLLVCIAPEEGFRTNGAHMVQAKYWTAAAAERLGDLTIQASLGDARELIRRRRVLRERQERAVVKAAEELLGSPSLSDPWGGAL